MGFPKQGHVSKRFPDLNYPKLSHSADRSFRLSVTQAVQKTNRNMPVSSINWPADSRNSKQFEVLCTLVDVRESWGSTYSSNPIFRSFRFFLWSPFLTSRFHKFLSWDLPLWIHWIAIFKLIHWSRHRWTDVVRLPCHASNVCIPMAKRPPQTFFSSEMRSSMWGR